MNVLAETVRDLLVPVLLVGMILTLGLLAALLVRRGVLAVMRARRERLIRRYDPLVQRVLSGDLSIDDLPPTVLRRRHLSVIQSRIVLPLMTVRGDYPERASALAQRLGLIDIWRLQLTDPKWWRQAHATLALGLIRDEPSVTPLVALLDHDHEQVRAAAIDGLGYLGDDAALVPLVERLVTPARGEFARIIEALRRFGPNASAALVQYGDRAPAHRAAIARALCHVGAPQAIDSLLEWTADADADVRAAAWSALAAVGPTDRVFYHALRAIGDPAEEVRTSATVAIGRISRPDAAPYLGRLLDDSWAVAARAARALARLGPAGERELRSRLDGHEGSGQALAARALWQLESRR